MTGVLGRKIRNRKRATTRRVLEISRAARSRNLKDSRVRLEAGYRRLLELGRATVRDAERVMGEWADGVRIAVWSTCVQGCDACPGGDRTDAAISATRNNPDAGPRFRWRQTLSRQSFKSVRAA